MISFLLDVLFKGFPYITKTFGFILAIVFFYYGITLNDENVKLNWTNIIVIFCIAILRSISIVLKDPFIVTLAFALGNLVSRKYKKCLIYMKR